MTDNKDGIGLGETEASASPPRAIRTLKEQFLWVQHFATVEQLRQALAEFAARYNATWIRQRHGYKTPDQIRAEKFGLASEAATAFNLAA